MACTSIGTKAAPPDANLFTNCHKETIREAFICAILFWKRFIGDIFLIFHGTTNQLQFLEEKDLSTTSIGQSNSLLTLHPRDTLLRHDPH